MTGEDAGFSGDPVVKLEADVVVAGIQPVEARDQEFETSGKIGTVFQHEDALVERAIDDVIFRRVKLLDRFLEITNSPVNDFRRLAGSGAGKIAGFDEHGV